MAKNILVIDDDILVTKSLSRLLCQQGYSVDTANSCQEALSKIEAMNFDLVVSDIKMPDIDGIQTVVKIKSVLSKKGAGDIPVIFITGFTDAQSYKSAKELNCADFIYKPFEKGEFLQSVSNSLGTT